MSVLWWNLVTKDEMWLKVILPNFQRNSFEANHLGGRTRVITVGLIGSEASSGLSSSTTGSLILSLLSRLKSFFSGNWYRSKFTRLGVGRWVLSILHQVIWCDEFINDLNKYVFYSLTIILNHRIGDSSEPGLQSTLLQVLWEIYQCAP